MNTLEYILEGMEAELALECELGVRAIEIEGAREDVLGASPTVQGSIATLARSAAAPSQSALRPSPLTPQPSRPASPPTRAPQPPQTLSVSQQRAASPILFVHHRPLEGDAAVMVDRICAALKLDMTSKDVVTAPPLPRAAVYVILGGAALRKFMPGIEKSPGQWINGLDGGASALVTYSPLFLLKYPPESAELKKAKGDMWQSLKNAMRRALGNV